MRTTIYVISDLHLGGRPSQNGDPGFQICSPETQVKLAAFIGSLLPDPEGATCRLVIAGDIVDFLAEEPFQDFTADPKAACDKLESIFTTTAPVWDALKKFVADGGALTLMLGNHDIELSLPGPRELLIKTLGPGRIDFICDNEAFSFGPLLIEHGNRFDAWNAVPHGALRRVRSQLSRKLPVTPDFPALPGSRLVANVMNPLKKDYHFLDLLKPETAGILPIVAALGVGSVRDLWGFFSNFKRMCAVDFDESTGEPVDESRAGDQVQTDHEQYLFAEQITRDHSAGGVDARGNLVSRIAGAANEQLQQMASGARELVRSSRRAMLLIAFQKNVASHRQAFAVHHEIDTYLVPARRAVQVGYQVIVYGHTHHAKRVPLGDQSAALPVYLNTGTWADLMRVPEAVWSDDTASASEVLKEFVDDLERNNLKRWRRAVPTYAKIKLNEHKVLEAGVFFLGEKELSTRGLLARLDGKETDVR